MGTVIYTDSTVLLLPGIYIPLLFMRAGRILMLRLFGISQVDAVSVLGTLNKDKAEFLMTGELLYNTGEQWDGGEGAIN